MQALQEQLASATGDSAVSVERCAVLQQQLLVRDHIIALCSRLC